MSAQVPAGSDAVPSDEPSNSGVPESELRLREMLDHSRDTVFYVRLPDRALQFVSRSCEELCGFTAEELVAQGLEWVFGRIHPDDRALVEATYARDPAQVEATRPGGTIEFRLRRHDGEYRWFSSRRAWVRDAAGRPAGLIGNIRDVAERKRTEEELRRYRDHLEELVQQRTIDLARLNERLQAELAERKQAEEALRRSEAKFRALVEHAPQRIFVKDRHSVYVTCNRNYARDLGIEPEAIAGRTDSEFYPQELAEKYRADDQRVITSGTAETFEEQYVSFGQERWVRTTKAPYRDDEGNIVGVFGIFEDITDRKRGEAAQRETEERLRAICTAAPIGIFLADDQAQCVYANPRLQAICGLSEPECLGYGWNASIDPEDQAAVSAEIARQQQTGGGFAHEFRLRRPDGSQRWVRAHTTDVQSGGPEVRLRVGIVEDITERRRAEEGLRESEAKFRALAETVAAAIVIARDRQVLYANSATEVLTGYTRAEYGQMDFWGIVHPEYRELVRQRGLARLKGEAVAARYEVKLLTKTGAERWVDLSLSVVEYDGQPALLATAFDITDRRRAEEQARQHQEQLAHVARVSTMGEMASGLAHELAQPLSAILYYAKGCVTHLRTGTWGTAEAAGAMEKVATQAQRAGEFIRRLKEFVRRAQPARAPADLNAIVRETLSLADYEAQAKRVAVRFEAAENLPKVVIDTIQIEQVILNLVRNGMDAMEQTPAGERELAIRTWTGPGDTVHVSVRDTGRGLSADAAAHLFDPFFTTKPEGTGLGLPISRSIIEAHEGQLWVQGDLPRGTLFGFTLPATQETKRAAD